MKTLAQEILSSIPVLMKRFTRGPIARDVAAYLAADIQSVRVAFDKLETEGSAKIVRRKRALHLVPVDYAGLICRICRAEYTLPEKSRRKTCSRSCGVAWSWQNPETAKKRKVGIGIERKSPRAKARIAAHNQRRWSRPEEHTKASELNRKQWRDPVTRAKRSVGIRKAHSSPEMKKFYSDLRKKCWSDPERRKQYIASMRSWKQTSEYKEKMRELMKARWRDPNLRPKYLAATRRNSEKARAKNKGSKQSPEHVRKRIEGRRKTVLEAMA